MLSKVDILVVKQIFKLVILSIFPKFIDCSNNYERHCISNSYLNFQNDFNKLKAKREAEQLRLLPARLPLQKSVSTPSIIAVRDIAPEPLVGAQPTLPM